MREREREGELSWERQDLEVPAPAMEVEDEPQKQLSQNRLVPRKRAWVPDVFAGKGTLQMSRTEIPVTLTATDSASA